jgi:hypothetical protein
MAVLSSLFQNVVASCDGIPSSQSTVVVVVALAMGAEGRRGGTEM